MRDADISPRPWRLGVRSLDAEVLEQAVAGGDGLVVGAHAAMLRVVTARALWSSGASPLRGARLSCWRIEPLRVSTLSGFHPSRDTAWPAAPAGFTRAALPVAGDRGLADGRRGYATAIGFARPLDELARCSRTALRFTALRCAALRCVALRVEWSGVEWSGVEWSGVDI